MITTVRAVEAVGPYRLVSLQQIFDPGLPGQFHMLRAVDGEAFLGRPLSAMRVGRRYGCGTAIPSRSRSSGSAFSGTS